VLAQGKTRHQWEVDVGAHDLVNKPRQTIATLVHDLRLITHRCEQLVHRLFDGW
jgi:hypothetical protein